MVWLVSIISIIIIASGSVLALTSSENFPHSMPMDYSDKYHLFWKYDDHTITFEVHVKTKGYIGFGISRAGGMEDSDIVIGWVKDGKPYFQDRYADGEAVPKVDESQDWELLEGKETDTHTILKFRRPLKTCDDRDIDILPGTTRLIWAYGATEPEAADQDPQYHGEYRGSRTTYLLSPPSISTWELPSDAIYVDFLSPNYTVPGRDTTYYCQGFSVPKLDVKHHILMIEPKIQPGNEAAVHHIIIYGCYHELNRDWYPGYGSWDDLHGAGGVCYEENMPTDECSVSLVGWAVGGGPIYFPEHVGYPVGGPDEKMLFMRMEIHYDNPGLRNDIIDSSGMRLWLSPTLRDHEMGMLMVGVGVGPRQVLPPGFPSLTSLGYCAPGCSQQTNDTAEEFKIVSAILHTHLAGTAIRFRHFRNGVEQPIIMRDDFYDFNFQDFRFLPEEVTVKLTDELVVECDYKTTKRTTTTWGGPATRDEMCLVFLNYYPKMELYECLSTPTIHQTMSYRPGNHRITSFRDFMEKIESDDWTNEENRKNFQKSITTGEHLINCGYQTQEYKSSTVQIPDYVKRLPPLPDLTCSAARLFTNWTTHLVMCLLCIWRMT